MMILVLYNNNVEIIDNNISRIVEMGEFYRFYHELNDGTFSIEIDTFDGKNRIMCHSNDIIVIDNRIND